MTVNYHSMQSNANLFDSSMLLFRWKGSVYKLLYKEFIIYFALYGLISVVYRFALSADQRDVFERIALVCRQYTSAVPILFLLGFYVTTVLRRWWDQLKYIPWPEGLCFLLTSFSLNETAVHKQFRHTVVRYLNAALVLRLREMGSAALNRFPTMQSFVKEELLTEEEVVLLESVRTQEPKYFVPCQWICRLFVEARKEGIISDQIMYRLVNEVSQYMWHLRWLLIYDRIGVPLVYTQVATWALQTFFAAQLLGRQFLDPAKKYQEDLIDFYVPIFTIFQFLFFFGWFKVAEALMNPFGDDDDDFDINWFINRHNEVGHLIVDECWDIADKLPFLSELGGKEKAKSEPQTLVTDPTPNGECIKRELWTKADLKSMEAGICNVRNASENTTNV